MRSPLTVKGAIIGTLQYMAPEQIDGKEIDGRTDIFAFGAVLYEMLTGQRPFAGKSQASLIGAILDHDPPAVGSLQLGTPPLLDEIVRRALAKDPDDRWQSARDLMRQMEWVAAQATTPASTTGVDQTALSRARARAHVLSLCAGLIAGAAAVGYWAAWRTPLDRASSVVRAVMAAPSEISTTAAPPYARFALSPDGTRLAFVGADESGNRRLWVRALEADTAQPIAGTEGASAPFWSPDGRWIAFVDGRRVPRLMKKVPAAGGAVTTIAENVNPNPATWTTNDVILFGDESERRGILRVSASGGVVSEVTVPDASRGEVAHIHPFALPDGRHFLYFARGTKAAVSEPNGLFVAAVDGARRQLVLEDAAETQFAAGHLFYMQGSRLMAQQFDVDALRVTGEPKPIAEGVAKGGLSQRSGAFSVSSAGVLVFHAADSREVGRLTWTRPGRAEVVVAEGGAYQNLRLAPDASMAAVSIAEPSGSRRIVLYDLRRLVHTRLTGHAAEERDVVWSPDGRRLVFNSRRDGRFDLYAAPTTDPGRAELLYSDDSEKCPQDYSADGRFLLYSFGRQIRGAGRTCDEGLAVLPMAGPQKPIVLTTGTVRYDGAHSSPDGRWIAYGSNDGDERDVYVMPFGDEGRARQRISASGGRRPRWSRDGRHVFYVSDGGLMATDIAVRHDRIEVGETRTLTRAGPEYDVAEDGSVLAARQAGSIGSVPFQILVNWLSLAGAR